MFLSLFYFAPSIVELVVRMCRCHGFGRRDWWYGLCRFCRFCWFARRRLRIVIVMDVLMIVVMIVICATIVIIISSPVPSPEMIKHRARRSFNIIIVGDVARSGIYNRL